MTRSIVGTVVRIDLFFGRHGLLVDEHAVTYRQRRLHAFAVANIEELYLHDPRRAILQRASNSAEVFARIHLCVGLLERNGALLLVGNAYPNHTELLWNLPGGRQDGHETCAMTVVRELREETLLDVRVGPLAYVAESFDLTTGTQFTAFCFTIEADGEPRLPEDDAHVRAYRWVPRAELADVLAVRVVREPLLGYLADRAQQYTGYLDAGITIAFGDETPAPPAAATERA